MSDFMEQLKIDEHRRLAQRFLDSKRIPNRRISDTTLLDLLLEFQSLEGKTLQWITDMLLEKKAMEPTPMIITERLLR